MATFTITSKKPFIIVDAVEYQDIQDRLERLEFLESRSLKKDIAEARQELKTGKTTSHAALKAKLLGD